MQTLRQIAIDLHDGKDFNITRLTMLKGFCEDSDAAAQFGVFLAKKSSKAIKESDRSSSQDKQYYGRLASKGVRTMTAYLKAPSKEAQDALWKLFWELRSVQNEHKKVHWTTVRIIKCRELFIVELALECILRSTNSPWLGYKIARQYAERYGSPYGTGLIPDSAPAVEDITKFLGQHFLGRVWREKLEK